MSATDGYFTPFRDAETEFSEKRSRFIGHVWRVGDEDEARRRIDETRRKYHDARHNCWCYLLRTGGVVRYADDGEPQGTAGQPMLNVFQKRGVTDVCCVVTRYFGGILLGAGGLTRAYSRSARDTLDAAGVARVTRWTTWDIPCPYALLDRLQRDVRRCGGRVSGVDYAASVTLHAAFPSTRADAFAECLRPLSLSMTPTGEAYLPGEADVK